MKRIVRQKYNHLYAEYWFKYLCSFVGAIYVNLMCIANIIGFGLGFDGVTVVLKKMSEDWVTECVIILIIMVAINVMFFVRFMEKDDLGY